MSVSVIDTRTLDFLPGIAMALDLEGRVVYWNGACAELTGRAAQDVYGKPVGEIMTNLDAVAGIEQMLESLRAGEPPSTFECRLVQTNGERRTFAISGVRAPGSNGSPLVVITGIDITQIVTRHEEDFAGLRALLEQAPEGIFIADLEGRYTDVNDAGCRMLGYSREEILGKTIVDLIPAQDEARLWSSREQLLTGAIERSDWTLCKKDGSQVVLDVSAKILPDGRWQALVRDTSERSALELSRRESLVAQRAIEARDEVLAIVAHELRSPLNTVLLQSEILRRRGTQGHRSLDAIRQAILRMNRLIGDLLDVTRLEAGALAFEPTTVPALSLLDEVVDIHWDSATAARLRLSVEAPASLPDLFVDHDRIIQVFGNLIGNAIKFTPPEGSVVVGAAPGVREVIFRVSDTGPGVSPEKLAHLFDRFWQVNRADRRGVGLGLPIVKGIVEAQGGRIWAESKPGQGMTFYFALPTV